MTGVLKLKSFAETTIQPSGGMLAFVRLDNAVAEYFAKQEDDFICNLGNKRFRLVEINDKRRKADWGNLEVSILVVTSGGGDLPVGPEEVRKLLPHLPVNQAVMYSTYSDGEALYAVINSVISPS